MADVIDNNGDNLFSTIYPSPDKETVILLHGGPGVPDDFMQVTDILRDAFQIVTFHQRGTGKSPCESGDYSMTAYLSDIEAVRRFYKIDRFHLFGHSWGGLYAQIYSEEHADNLLSLFLSNPGSGTNTEWRQTEKEVMQFNKSKCTIWQWSQMAMNNLLGMLGSNQAYQRLFARVMKNYNDGYSVADYSSIDFSNLRAAPINKTRPEIIKHPLLKGLADPSFKVTITYGDQDIYQSSKDFVIHRYPTADVITIPNCGHLPWLHSPAKYEEVLTTHFGKSRENKASP
jgi:proline iminopeptidase